MLEILREADSKMFGTTVFTNGLTITERVARELGELRYLKVQVSLDAATRGLHDYHRGLRGAFDAAIGAIKRLRKYGVCVGVGTAISRYNLRDLEKLARLLKRLGVSYWVISTVMPFGRGKDAWRDLFPSDYEFANFLERYVELMKTMEDLEIGSVFGTRLFEETKRLERMQFGFRCTPYQGYFAIFPNGDVGPCDRMPHLKLGNLRENTLEELFQKEELIREQRAMARQAIYACQSCKYFKICGGGCLGVILSSSDLEDQYVDPIACRFFHLFYDRLLEFVGGRVKRRMKVLTRGA